MENEKFTPGPWSVNNGILLTRINDNKHNSICGIHFINTRELNSGEECDANAVLIAAAPDLYHALKNLKECLESYLGKTEKDFFEDCDHYDAELYFAKEYIDACNVLKKSRGEK